MALRVATPPAPAKFGVYENPTITSALARQTMQRKPWHLPIVLLLFCASLWAAWNLQFSRAEELVAIFHSVGITHSLAGTIIQIAQWSTTIFFLMTLSAVFKVVNMQASPDRSLTLSSRAKKRNVSSSVSSGSPTVSPFERQQGPFLPPGASPKKWYDGAYPTDSSARQRPTRGELQSTVQTSPLLVPVHPQSSKSSKPPTSSWNGRSTFVSPVGKSPGQTNPASSPAPESPYQITPYPGPAPQGATPVSQGSTTPSTVPRSRDRIRSGRLEFGKDDIDSERKLFDFLAEVDNKLADTSGRSGGLATPSPTVQGVASGPSPGPAATTLASVQSAPRSAVRALQISPSVPKTGSPMKGEVEMPLPMSMEQAAEVLKRLGVYSQIEQWRDRLRQWFSDVLLNPLVRKIDSSHLQTMAAASNLGLAVSVSEIGSKQDGWLTPISSDGSQQEWLTTMAPDEDAFLHQFRSALLQARDGHIPTQNTLSGLSPPQDRVYNLHIQACLDAVTEHQRLKALMKGEWVKGLLPQSSIRTDFVVQRIRDLAEGTCVKAYEFWLNGEVYDKMSKRWISDLPSDAHLLLYLFCALLEHPQWMLHVDPTSYPSTQSSNNSLFIASLPQKERYPEKYIAIISGAPPVLHAGATVLAIGKQSPPVFALYWDKKLQYSFQGRSALWDAILLLCYRVKLAHGGVVRGINLGSPAFNLLSVLEPCFESPSR
ncbi:unnamed protein product [Calypogeia fissa]